MDELFSPPDSSPPPFTTLDTGSASLRKVASFHSVASTDSAHAALTGMEDDGRALFFTVTNVAETDAGRRAIDEWAFQTTPLDYDPATASATFDRGTVLLTHDYFGEKVWDQMGRNEQQRALSKCAVSPEVFLSETSRQKVVAASHAQASMVVGTVRAAASERRDGSGVRGGAAVYESHAKWTERARRNSKASLGRTPLEISKGSFGASEWASMSADRKRSIVEFAAGLGPDAAAAGIAPPIATGAPRNDWERLVAGRAGRAAAAANATAHRADADDMRNADAHAAHARVSYAAIPPPAARLLGSDPNWPFRGGIGPALFGLLFVAATLPCWIGWVGEWTNMGEWKNDASPYKAAVGDVANRFGMMGLVPVLVAFLCAPAERASVGLIGATAVFWGWTVSYPLFALLFTLFRNEWFASIAFAFQLCFTHPLLYLALSGISHRLSDTLRAKLGARLALLSAANRGDSHTDELRDAAREEKRRLQQEARAVLVARLRVGEAAAAAAAGVTAAGEEVAEVREREAEGGGGGGGRAAEAEGGGGGGGRAAEAPGAALLHNDGSSVPTVLSL